jgi:hypothetical protein
MTLRTPLCDLLGVEHPIMLAGMGGVSYAELVAAVSNAGGYGVLGMAGTGPDFIREQMRQVRRLTDKPFGVDLLAASPESLTASVEVIIEEGASAFIAGLGVPMPIMQRLKAAGLLVMVVCGAVRHAQKAEQAGCDAVICQGGEGGGHTGLVGTMPLVAQAVERVRIPVVAAGGLYDGRGLAAALALGAQGVWMGTRFIASAEAHAGDLYRQTIVGRPTPTPCAPVPTRASPCACARTPGSKTGNAARATSSPSRSRRSPQAAPASWAASAARSRASTPTAAASPWARAPAASQKSSPPPRSSSASSPRPTPASPASPRFGQPRRPVQRIVNR